MECDRDPFEEAGTVEASTEDLTTEDTATEDAATDEAATVVSNTLLDAGVVTTVGDAAEDGGTGGD